MHVLTGFVGKQAKNIMKKAITPNNMEAMKEAFKEFDTNADGFISKDELSNAMANFGHVISNDEIDKMIALVDVDGNGLVDFKEFIHLMDNNCLIQNEDDEMKNLFHMFDANKDGYITEKEIKNMMKNLGEKVRKKDVRKMMKEADLNKDGKISFREFKIMVENGNFV